MRELKISTARLARETGLSETTIRYLGRAAYGHNKSTLVAIAAVLRWRHDYLVNVLHGEPEKNVPVRRAAEENLQRLLRDEIGPVKAELATLSGRLDAVNEKLDAIAARAEAPDPGGRPRR
jgi:DNA-binding transcriptional MerR regulator